MKYSKNSLKNLIDSDPVKIVQKAPSLLHMEVVEIPKVTGMELIYERNIEMPEFTQTPENIDQGGPTKVMNLKSNHFSTSMTATQQ